MISGIRQHIANYPGVTVDKKSGFFSIADVDVEMVDLPGTYSFSSYSLEEKVAKEFIVNEKPEVILNIIDASNLKRNLYLTFQLLEIGVPVVIVLNMLDVAKRRGIIIDAGKIAKILKCPVICASASKGEGKAEILDVLRNAKNLKQNYEEFKVNYEELEPFVLELQNSVSLDKGISTRWLCIKALENDAAALNLLKNSNAEIEDLTAEQRAKFNEKTGKSIEAIWLRLDTKTRA
ncbi:FeoB small GTPase domain-containing protein [Campylobacter concisus]|uniref:FeoB small GTPase domain-containing protein n=1 Tax=Campylobacter concisus TaxID=199 RepID=UPI001CB6F227|nr:FeoB small GTPase domain-containing protein [Campylobacter concisus]